MAIEYETKVLDIDVKEINNKLLELGAKKWPEVLMRRWVFDIDSKENEWIRLRDDGKNVTITYKHRKSNKISETEEIETKVDDFDAAFKILSRLKFKNTYYQENKRIIYTLKDIEFMIDFWPNIPPHLEVESSSEKKVKEGLALLGLDSKDDGNLSVVEVYSKHGIDMHSFKEMVF